MQYRAYDRVLGSPYANDGSTVTPAPGRPDAPTVSLIDPVVCTHRGIGRDADG
ncbi:hypothetical protein QIS99_19145 [Streptomyces sp. B-S-A8]|uniref:Uncharacterized protein n=1 Tax=Streptomyces solicavernae TaxID=3043614 RepID=A0ABT6RV40_9ACTN|nr:hypothetical protein [Streptomyces sp. B-S-A8]MDI3388303.1 hypothetical protein [Streptomyces sp. B-S-A8]